MAEPAGRKVTGSRLTLLLVLLLAALVVPGVAAQSVASDERVEPPFEVRYRDTGGVLAAQIISLIDFPFDTVAAALTAPEAWCEFIPLVFNVKACTFEHREDAATLTLYIARRFDDPLPRTTQLRYRFEVQKDEAGRVLIVLSAPRGPHGTRDYRFELDLRPADDGRTELLFHSSFRPSLRSRLATRAYLGGAGRDKAGFSVERYRDGEPVYVGGVQGVIERNAMRHFLALEAFLETLHLPEHERFEASLRAWFEATERYPEQLYEMEKEEYLVAKRRERQRQEEMQGRIGQGEVALRPSPVRGGFTSSIVVVPGAMGAGMVTLLTQKRGAAPFSATRGRRRSPPSPRARCRCA